MIIERFLGVIDVEEGVKRLIRVMKEQIPIDPWTGIPPYLCLAEEVAEDKERKVFFEMVMREILNHLIGLPAELTEKLCVFAHFARLDLSSFAPQWLVVLKEEERWKEAEFLLQRAVLLRHLAESGYLTESEAMGEVCIRAFLPWFWIDMMASYGGTIWREVLRSRAKEDEDFERVIILRIPNFVKRRGRRVLIADLQSLGEDISPSTRAKILHLIGEE